MDPPVWAPHVIQDLNDGDLRLYLEFSRTACIRGGGCNVEKALQVLFLSNGDIKLAIERLLLTNATWNEDEIHTFERSIECHGKNFPRIQEDVKTKSVKECVEFYYLWKKSPIRNSSSSLGTNTSSTSSTSSTPTTIQLPESFPCKVCGKVFEKIKSRSAHMKRHKNERVTKMDKIK